MNKAIAKARVAIDKVIKQFGSAATIDKQDGTSIRTIGVALAAETKDDTKTNLDDYLSYISKDVYVSGKMKAAPEQGDSITLSPNTYTIIAVEALTVGEGEKNVFAYKLTVGT